MTERQKEQRRLALAKSHGICAICGKPLNDGEPQYAHKIANTEQNRAKYGWFFIDDVENGDYVCSLACNQDMNMQMNEGEVLNLLSDILIRKIKEFRGRNGNQML